jgi:glycosyltransferase involved in cell wall biosynthesis
MNPFTLVSLVRRAVVVCLMNHWTALNAVVYWVCRMQRKPYTVCPAGALQPFGRSAFLKKAYNWIVGRQLIKNASACIAITKSEIDDFLGYGVDMKKIHIIPNGIDPEDFPEDISSDELKNFRSRHGLGEYPIILFMGRLNRIKGPDLLLEAFFSVSKVFPAHRLVFVGPDNGLELSLKKAVGSAGLDGRVRFLGYLGGREKACAYRMADVLVIPSRQEAMSLVVLEAGISGTPVLATDRCGLDDLAAEGVVKIVAPTSEAISEGLLDLLRHPVEARDTGVRLKRSVCSRYLWSTQAGHYLRLFQEIQTIQSE